MAIIVGTYQTDDDDIALLPLKTVNRVHRDKLAHGAEPFFLPDKLAQALHLGLVGRNDPHVDALLHDAPDAGTLHQRTKRLQGEPGLGLIDTAIGVAHKMFAGIHSGGVNPLQGPLQVKDTGPLAHAGGGMHTAAVEPL